MSATLTLTHIRTLPNDRRSNPIDEDELEEERETLLIKYNNCSKGLGIKIIGGCSVDGEEDYGIFVKRVLPGGLAQLEGQLQNGDQILKVNGDSLEGVTNDRAVAILRKASASNVVSLLVSRDHQAREEFGEVLERQNLVSHNCTPVPTETPSRASSKTSSRSTSPSFTEGKSNGSPRNENLHQKHNQENGLMDSPRVQSEEPPPAHGQITPVTNRTLPVAQVERFGARIQPDMASTPHGGRLKGLPSYSDSQSILAGSHNLSPVLASPAATVTTPLTHNSHTPALGTGGGSQPQGPSQLPQSQDMSQTRKLSLDPHVRLKVERLEDALRYLGLDPTLEQQAALRRNLHVDPSGTVSYGEFVKEAREVFRMQLDEQNIGQGAMLFAAQDLTSLVEPPPFKPELSTIPDTSVNEDLELIRKERDNLSKEVDRLKVLLKEKEESCSVAEDEILRIRRQAQGAIHETRSLRSKVHLAEQAQRAARSMEQDYEEVVRLLEKEIADMRTELHRKQETPNAELEKRLAVVSCQLRKTDSAKKTFEVATEKLLQFVEHVHETLRNEESSASRSRIESGEPPRGNRPPGYLGKHKAPGVRGLASEAREVVKAVKSLTDSQGLPYGWEEAYTEDGMRYYINHLTQMTTWSHPVSNIHHLPTIHQQPGSDATGQKAPAPGQRSEVNGPQASVSGNGAAHRGIPLSKGSGRGISSTEPSQVSR